MPLDDPQPYGPQAYGLGNYGQDQGEDPAAQAKKFVPLLIGLLVVAGLAYFAYDYFVLSIQHASFSVLNTEKEPLTNATIRIYPLNQATPIATFSGEKTLELRKGDYEYEAASAGYKPLRATFAVADGSNDLSIQLTKNIDVDLDLELPANMVLGQSIQGKVKLKNNKPTPDTIDLVFDGILAPDVMDVTFESIVLGGNSSDEIPFKLSVKDGVDPKKLGKDKKGGVRIKYTLKRKDASLSVLAFDAAKVSVNISRVDFGKVNAGDAQQKEFKITNSNHDLDLKDIELSVEDVKTQNNTADAVKGWFSFTPEKIDSIAYGNQAAETANIRVEVPANASDDKVNARIRMHNAYWDKSINLEMDVKGKSVALALEGLNDKYTLSKDPSTGKYKPANDVIELVNKGDTPVQNVSVAVDTQKCDSSWVTLGGLTDFAVIDATQKTKDTTIVVNAPDKTAKGFLQNCLVLVRYSDPFTPLDRKVIQKTFGILTQ